MSGGIVKVAAAVLLRAGGDVLLAQRPAGKAYAGYWEFPGGKFEAGETPREALVRELAEELGIAVTKAAPWFVQEFVYPHARVELHFFRVYAWTGELVGQDGQAFAWQTPGYYTVGPLLPANTHILAALELPLVYAITCAADSDEEAFLLRAERALAGGLRLLQVRDREWPLARRLNLARTLAVRARHHGATLLWNGSVEEAHAADCTGVHWTAATLMRELARPEGMLVAASCHTRDEVERAGLLGLDFAVLGPVMPTATHPQAVPIGWNGFAELSEGARLPVYALGGLTGADLDAAIASGAHGVALRRAGWPG